MTRPEALTTLRDARDTYTNLVAFLNQANSDMIRDKGPIKDARLLQLYVIDKLATTTSMGNGAQIFRWRELAFPLYYAIRMASDKFRRSCPDGDLLARINHQYRDYSQIERMAILIRTCIDILHGDH